MLTHVVVRQFRGDAGILAPGALVNGDEMPNAEPLEAERYMRRMAPEELRRANASPTQSNGATVAPGKR